MSDRSVNWRICMLKSQHSALIVLVVFPCLMFAQSSGSDEQEKTAKRSALIAETTADIPNLKLPENRAIAYARVGNLSWNADQKRARSLYQNAITELVNAQMAAESNRKANANQNELLTGGATRPQVLNAIAAHDAEFALEALAKTRPAAIEKALVARPQANKVSGYGNTSYLAQNERNMEQSFLRMAADQNPERAEKLIKDALAKGITNETFGLLKKLAERNASEAADLATQVVDKLLQSPMTVDGQLNYQTNQMMVTIVNEYIAAQKTENPTLKFDDSQMRSIAQKLISYFLERGNRDGNWLAYSIVPIAEKFNPGSVDKIKTAAKNMNCGGKGLCSEYGYDADLQKLMNDGETTAEQLIAAAKKFAPNQRYQIYQRAATKMINDGSVDEARHLLSENFSDEALNEVMQNLDSQYSYHLINQGRFEEAERLIDTFPEGNRFSSLISLASSAYQRDPEKNKSYAVALIRKARDLINEPPENSNEFQNLIQAVAALTNIDIREAFQIYESLVPQMNELSDAAAVINGFQNSSQVRSGEFLLSQGSSFGFYVDYSPLRSFIAADFDRTMKLINGLSRREMRLSIKLQMAEAF